MTKVVPDHGHVGARLQQRDRATVSQHVGRDALARKRRTFPGERRGMLAQDVGNAIAGQRLTQVVEKDVLLISRLGWPAAPGRGR